MHFLIGPRDIKGILSLKQIYQMLVKTQGTSYSVLGGNPIRMPVKIL